MKNIFLILCSFIMPVRSLSEITPKLCVNCKYFKHSFLGNKYGKCTLFPKDQDEDNIDFFVTGKNDFMYCSTARIADDMCGKEGTKYIHKPNKLKDVLNNKICKSKINK